MKIWKIGIVARYCDALPRYYTYTGTATTVEVAIRQVKRATKKEGFSKVEVQTVEYLGKKEFGR